MEILYWLFVGLVAGWLAGMVMKGSGYGIIGDIILGILGGLIGGWLVSLIGLGANGLIASILVAAFGAIVLVWLVRLLTGRTARV